jgi:Arc/MetJ-type ribon-helix-helix transcriptional regulator
MPLQLGLAYKHQSGLKLALRAQPGKSHPTANFDIFYRQVHFKAMSTKAVLINISLNPELAEFARQDAQAHAFDSMSEYMRDLIRKRRQEEIGADVAFLEKAIEGAPLGDPSDEEMAEIVKAQHRIRTRNQNGPAGAKYTL